MVTKELQGGGRAAAAATVLWVRRIASAPVVADTRHAAGGARPEQRQLIAHAAALPGS